MSAHVLLNNLLNNLRKSEACPAFYCFFATSLINLIILEHEFRFYLSHDITFT